MLPIIIPALLITLVSVPLVWSLISLEMVVAAAADVIVLVVFKVVVVVVVGASVVVVVVVVVVSTVVVGFGLGFSKQLMPKKSFVQQHDILMQSDSDIKMFPHRLRLLLGGGSAGQL